MTTKTTAIETTKLNNGTVVLARKDRSGYMGAATYTNWTQAENKVYQLQASGVNASVYNTGVVKYIKIA